MERKGSGLAVLAAVAAMLCLVFTMPAFAGQTDNVLSEHIKEADGTTGQDTNSGSGVKTGHIQDGAITTPKIVNGAVTDDKISGTISGSKLGSHTHSGSDVTLGTIGVDKLATYSGVRIVHKGAADGVNTFNTISAALSSISGNSATNRYAVMVKPGIYNSSSATMKDYVDVIGSGQGNTILEYNVATGPVVTWPSTVNNAALENLTVRGTGGGGGRQETIRIEGSATIRDATVIAANYSQAAIYFWSWGYLEMYNSKVTIEAGVYSSTFLIDTDGDGVLIKDCIIDVSMVSGWAIGVFGPYVTIDNSIVNVNAADGAYGVLGDNNTISNSTITTSTNTDDQGNHGVEGRNVKIHNSTVVASAATTPRNDTCGVYSSGTVEVNNSVVSGSTFGIKGNFKIGNSQIIGGHDGSAGSDKVVNCHDGSYNPIPNL